MKKMDFNAGWQYGHPGEGKKAVQLPHDAMLADGRASDAPTGSAGAYYKAGIYEYEKEFDLTAQQAKGSLKLQFEGVMRNAKVSVNGAEAGGAPYGYIPFWIDLGKYAKAGKNTVRVTADNSEQPASRWYAGGGIYRPVWLWEGGSAVIAPQGLKVKTLSVKVPRIEVRVETEGASGVGKTFSVQLEILDASGVSMAKAAAPVDGESGTAAAVMDLPGAKLWSEDAPNLYVCRAVLVGGDEKEDEAETYFGIREVTWSGDGLFINGKSTLLRGGSVHHDHGVIGAVSTPESEWRRVRILKESGFNALRIAHNPASEELLRACDYYGVYVADETWDMWYNHKNTKDYAGQFKDHYVSDIEEMAARDYNHPSVIMYSIGNEVSEPAKEQGVALGKEIIDRFHALDDTRAVTGGINIMILSQSAKGDGIYKEEGGRDDSAEKKTQGMNSTMFNFVTSMVGTSMNRMGNSKKADEVSTPILDALDICGYNYGSGRYPMEEKAHPGRVVYGSEIFPQDVAKNWAVIEKYPYLVGDFLWTAWDYIGECGLGAWAYDADGKGFDKPYPWKLADSGALDILGDPNGEMFWSQAAWGVLKGAKIGVQPANHPGVKPAKATWRGTNALPSWSWSGCEGNKTVVEVYTKGASVELFLNDKRIGKKKTKECRAIFRASYEPGTLKAVAYDAAGKKLGEDVLISAAGKVHLDTSVVKEPVSAPVAGTVSEAMETVYIEISLKGENGVVESNQDRTLHVAAEGAELLGFGSAKPRTEEDFLSGEYATYYGRALAVVRRPAGTKSKVVITCDGTDAVTLEI